mgnify:FL=1
MKAKAMFAYLLLLATTIPTPMLALAEIYCAEEIGPPQVNYIHTQIHDYLFTFTDVSGDSSGGSIDPFCFKQYFVVTQPNEEPSDEFPPYRPLWFKQSALYESTSWSSIHYEGSIGDTQGTSSFAIFLANTYGNKSDHVLVFKTKPAFEKVFEEHGYYLNDEPLNGGFRMRKEWSYDRAADRCDRSKLSSASMPYDKLEFRVDGDTLISQVVEPGTCPE